MKASDPSVDVSISYRQKTAAATICIVTDVHKIHDSDQPRAQALQSNIDGPIRRKKHRKNRKLSSMDTSDASFSDASISDDSKDESNQSSASSSIFYPHEVIVYRKSTKYSRVMQPINMLDVIKRKSPVFQIKEDRTGAFNITPNGGIVYVQNTTSLQLAAEMLY